MKSLKYIEYSLLPSLYNYSYEECLLTGRNPHASWNVQ